MKRISVLLAEDSLIVREGVRALLAHDHGVHVIDVAADYGETIAKATALAPQVLVTDIRMPPNFQDEGIEAAKEVRRRHPGTGVVILSQYENAEYAIELLSAGSEGYAYLLKDRIAEPSVIGRAIRTVATGGSMIDPDIANTLIAPARAVGVLSEAQDALLHALASGRTVKAIAARLGEPPEAVNDRVEEMLLTLAREASSGEVEALRRLRLLHTAIVEREEQGETLSRLLPSGLAEKLRTDHDAVSRTERLTVTVLMSDVRGYSGIAERADPIALAGQLNEHRREMNTAILAVGGTVMQYVGDAVMAVFGAPDPQPEHAAHSVRAALAMHARQAEVNRGWAIDGLPEFGMGIGLSTGEVAAALLGSSERLEYTVVGDTVNLAQRLQDRYARPAGRTVANAATVRLAGDTWRWESLGSDLVKGRTTPVEAFLLLG